MHPVMLTWQDVEEIGRDLAEKYPEVDPLKVPLATVRTYVTGLARFSDDPAAADDRVLEAIQAAWYDAYEG